MKSTLSAINVLIFTFHFLFFHIATAAQEIDLATLPLYFCPNDGPNKSQANTVLNAMSMTDSANAYQTGFDSARWSGILRKYVVNKNAGGSISLSKQKQWDAGVILTDTLANQRTITTYNASVKAATPFELSSLPAETQMIFELSPSTGIKDNLGIQRIQYLYGDRTLEHPDTAGLSATFRVRDSVLGDIVNSLPIYVGGAAKNIVGTNYQPFYEQFKNRPGTIYVGANDGMLHAFSADTGRELFAYVPSPLLSKLPKLTDPSYQHESTMDGNIHVGEAQVSGVWKTVLAAGMGSGAQGVFALDVTSPGEFMQGRPVLFEFTSRDDADIGYVTATPLIAKIAVGKNADGSANYQYFVIVPSGYNSSNLNGDSFLFLLSLNKDPAAPWRANGNYFKLRTASKNTALPNALSTPGLALNAQGATVYAYAGDLQGSIWRFDFSAGILPTPKTPLAIFSAADTNSEPQPITTKPAISFAPGGGYLLLFGTGKYIESADTNPADFKSNSFYAIRDTLSDVKENYLISSRNELAQRILVPSAAGYDVTGTDFNYGEGQLSGTKKGWYVDFLNSAQTGERSISNPLIAYGNVIFNTLIPNTATCNNSGTGKSYMFDVLTGKTANSETSTGIGSKTGALGSPFVILSNTALGMPNAIGQRNSSQFYSIFNFANGDAGGTSVFAEKTTVVKAGRLSWREIQNWQDLK